MAFRQIIGLFIVSLAVMAGCAEPATDEKPAASGRTPHSDDGCPVSALRSGPLPQGLGGGFTGEPPPWMGDENFVAVLFYARPDDATISPGGKMPNGGNTKILWVVRNSRGPLTIRGVELRGGKEFTQTVDGGGSYPSIVDVPSAGCWTLRVALPDREVGAITLPAK